MRLDPRKKARSDLKSYFVKNAIPTESNFANLIDSGLNQRDDGIVKASGDPLSIEASGDDSSQKKAINFYGNFNDPKPSWVLSLQPRSDPADPNTRRPGLSIGDGDGNSRLFIDPGSGRVGIGTTEPTQNLDVAGKIACHGLSLARTNTDRQPLFLAVAGDLNHALYNNYSDVDGEGSWDGAKWNTYAGLDIRVGGDKKSALKIAPNGNLVVSGKLDGRGELDVAGAIAAGNSDIYFTKTDHNHTGIGNAQGHAAIENGASHDALMILGRAGTNVGRKVRLWDFLEVNGPLWVTGAISARNSDIYFTKTDHNHSLIGNAPGHAAIENAKDYDSLMILGRSGTANGRKVRLWDYLQVNGTFVNSSDARSKRNIQDLEYGLEEVRKLRPVSFDWKKIPNPHKSLGLVAQEVQGVLDEVVYGDDGRLSIAYTNLIPVLINAIKELDRRLDAVSTLEKEGA